MPPAHTARSQTKEIISVRIPLPSFGTNSRNSLDPLLVALNTNGGPTMTMALLSNSPAINAGNNSAAPAQDQRGYSWTGTSSIGALL